MEYMERYSRIKITHQLNSAPLSIFDLKALKQYLNVRSDSGLYLLIKQLVTEKVLIPIKPGLYYVEGRSPNHFLVANHLVVPSYVSLESALNFHHLLPQFPMIITSVTLKKTQAKSTIMGEFTYTSITPKLYFGFQQQSGYLIADPEKALIDYVYIKNKTGLYPDLDEWDFSDLDTVKLQQYLTQLTHLKSYRQIVHILKEKTPCLP